MGATKLCTLSVQPVDSGHTAALDTIGTRGTDHDMRTEDRRELNKCFALLDKNHFQVPSFQREYFEGIVFTIASFASSVVDAAAGDLELAGLHETVMKTLVHILLRMNASLYTFSSSVVLNGAVVDLYPMYTAALSDERIAPYDLLDACRPWSSALDDDNLPASLSLVHQMIGKDE